MAGDLGQIDKPKAMLFVTIVKVGHCQLWCMLRACMPFWDASGHQRLLSGALTPATGAGVLVAEAAARSTCQTPMCCAWATLVLEQVFASRQPCVAMAPPAGAEIRCLHSGLSALQATNVPKMDFMSDSDPFVL